MKKRILTIALAVALVALAGYSTLAYFTATDTATNTVTAGKLEIVINEYDQENPEEPVEENNDGITLAFDNVVPGDMIAKIVKIKSLEGNIDAYIRAKIDMEWDLNEENDPEESTASDAVVIPEFADGWSLGTDGYYYYAAAVSADTEIDFLNGLYFDFEEMGNEYQGATLTITITAEAVQSKNNAAANGWPATEETTADTSSSSDT